MLSTLSSSSSGEGRERGGRRGGGGKKGGKGGVREGGRGKDEQERGNMCLHFFKEIVGQDFFGLSFFHQTLPVGPTETNGKALNKLGVFKI